MTGGFIWYELMTPDPDAAGQFYQAVVGWNFGDKASPDQTGGQDYRMIVRHDGGFTGGVLGLTAEMCGGGARAAWVGYIHVGDVDASLAVMLADGAKVLMPASDLPVGRIAMVTDPQGAPFYLMAPVPPSDQPDAKSTVFSVDQAQHMRWNELSTTDPQAALAFYQKHFGWGQQGELDMGGMGTYRFIQHGDVTIGAVMPKMGGEVGNFWGHYIGVDDIDRAIAAVTAGGGTALHGPQEIPGGEFSFNGIDPQGGAFGLVGPRKV